MRRILTALLPYLLLSFLVILFFLPLFSKPSIFYTPGFGSSDIWQQNFPLRDYVVRSLRNGHLPLWVPELGQGFPLLAEGQIGFFNLINLLPSLLLPSWLAFNIIYLLIFLLMSTATYTFARSLGLSGTAAFLSAIAFTFSAKTIVSIHHINLLLSLAFLPLNLWLTTKLINLIISNSHARLPTPKRNDGGQALERGSYLKTNWGWLLWTVFLALGLSQQFLAGHPQVAFYSWMVILTYGFLRVLYVTKLKQRFNNIYYHSEQLVGAFAPLLVAFLLAVGLSAIQLLPMIELVKVSTRAGGIADLEPYPFRPKHLLMFLRPDWFGNSRFGTYPIDGSKEGFFWENVGYIGLIPLLLAIFAISVWIITVSATFLHKLKTQNSKFKTTTKNLKFLDFFSNYHATVRGSNLIVGFFVVLTVVSILLAFGKASPFFFLLQLSPFNFFRVPARFLLLTVFSLSILAGFGIDQVIFALQRRQQGLNPQALFNPSTFNLLPFTSLLPFALLLLTLFDLWSFGLNYNPRAKINEWLTPPATAEFLKSRPDAPKQGATSLKVPPSDERVADIGSETIWNSIFWEKGWGGQEEWYLRFRNSLTPDSNLLFDIPSTGVYAGILPTRSNFIFDLFKELGPRGLSLASDGTVPVSDEILKLFSLTNTRYLISGFPLKNENLKFLYQTQFASPYYNYGIWENTKVLPRAYFVTSARFTEGTNEAKKALLIEAFDPKQSVIIESSNLQPQSSKSNLQPPNPQILPSLNSNFKISWIKDEPRDVELTITAPTDGWLVLSDSYYPGWRAYVDGKETKIFAANVNGRAVKIQTGPHQIKFLYQPQGLLWGGWITTISLIGMFCLIVFARTKKDRNF